MMSRIERSWVSSWWWTVDRWFIGAIVGLMVMGVVLVAGLVLSAIGLVGLASLPPAIRRPAAVVLVTAALAIGLLTGLGVDGAVKAVTEGFGGIMAEVGLLIAFGVLIGSLLQAVGAIEAVVRALFERTGARRTPR